MRAKTALSLLALFILAVSCQTGSFVYYNDIYVKSSDTQYQAKKEKTVVSQSSESVTQYYATDEYLVEQEVFNDGTGNTYVTNNYYYDESDIYDFYYTSRLRRFHTNVSLGFGYYDPFYTNMYWYTYSPAYWGVSIYLGYNWWWPSYYYRPWYYDWGWYSYGFNYGWGWGCHRPWYFGGYWNGYYDGYYSGYWAGYYHNHFDNNTSYYYGHRNSLGGASTGRSSNRNIFGNKDEDDTHRLVSRSSTPESFNQRFGDISRGTSNSSRSATTATGSGSRAGASGSNTTASTSRSTSSGTRQTETARPSTPPSNFNQQTSPTNNRNTYDSGFRPDNSRSTPTYTPPASDSRSSYSSPGGSSGFSSPSSSSPSRGGSSSSSSGNSNSGSRNTGSGSGGTRR